MSIWNLAFDIKSVRAKSLHTGIGVKSYWANGLIWNMTSLLHREGCRFESCFAHSKHLNTLQGILFIIVVNIGGIRHGFIW